MIYSLKLQYGMSLLIEVAKPYRLASRLSVSFRRQCVMRNVVVGDTSASGIQQQKRWLL